MSEERITYEEFMIMYKNAPRFAYTLYDKAEDEIEKLQQKVEQLENIRKIAIAFVKNNKDKTIAPYGDNEDTDYEVCLFEDDIENLLNILNKGSDKK